MLEVSERQLRSWEKQKFLSGAESFDFSDLLALRMLVGLRASKVSPAQIRNALGAIRERLGNVRNPLTEVRIYSHGRKIEVLFEGQKMEPVTGQLLLNFDEVEIKKLLSFPAKTAEDSSHSGKHQKRREAEMWFEKGLDLENTGAPLEDVIDAYQKAIAIDPSSAGALVNLGTVLFNLHEFREAERHYRRALEVDPDYALAHYNMGNLYDERGERLTALTHYQAALRIHPNYPDAHYNIALVYQALNQPWKAVQHWKTYLKLDPGSPWSDIARKELEKLRASTIVQGGPSPRRFPRPKPAAKNPTDRLRRTRYPEPWIRASIAACASYGPGRFRINHPSFVTPITGKSGAPFRPVSISLHRRGRRGVSLQRGRTAARQSHLCDRRRRGSRWRNRDSSPPRRRPFLRRNWVLAG